MDILQNPGSCGNPGRFSSQLRDALASKLPKPSDVWSIPESIAIQEEDCPYDMETQSYAGENHVPMDEDTGDGAEGDWDMEAQSAADDGPEAVHSGEADVPVLIGKCSKEPPSSVGARLARKLETCSNVDMLMEISRYVEIQLDEQNRWNDEIVRGMETIQRACQEISALKAELAMLKDQMNSLSKDSPGTGRRPGRPPRRVAE
ncbi:hypothetical protein N7537_010372 [Penicillium hordei]|uniref:Uncharacterized protein n=1 Tax=Penicillium hordei TaxID=40994 RepID=A0AAD6DUV8_9EURO|nr:uncharacterized protein N7537_010372 [Penicillium hordei]KAJ5593468.1 hypothetical protein N7537_010372 [Penicillium hordei]